MHTQIRQSQMIYDIDGHKMPPLQYYGVCAVAVLFFSRVQSNVHYENKKPNVVTALFCFFYIQIDQHFRALWRF